MEAIGQLQAAVALPQYLLNNWLCRTPDSSWMIWRIETCLTPHGIRNLDRSARSLVIPVPMLFVMRLNYICVVFLKVL
jgi:hypothetical protein